MPEPEDAAPEVTLDRMLRDLAAHGGLTEAEPSQILAGVESMVRHVDYPCVGAKSVFRRDGIVHLVLPDLRHGSAADRIRSGLVEFAAAAQSDPGFHSFLVSFRQPSALGEAEFERLLWALLQRIHDGDEAPWAPGVSADPGNPHFAFSAGNTAYFVIGLHPGASRIARRAPLPTIVFNPHEQFEQLRASGRFDGMRATIRRRDRVLQGCVNPMVADHGDTSEALQYSGRAHDAGWQPPLQVRPEAKERRA